jgi:Skp family chaperone for outer membrane proteins
MEIRVVDFDRLTRSYSKYREGILSVDLEKNKFLTKLDPVKKEMESIIESAKSGIVLDSGSQRQKELRFADLQQEAMMIDGDFKVKMRELHDELNKKTFDELSEIISEWGESNSIDLVTGKMEVVFAKEKYDATDEIILILKERGYFFEDVVDHTQTSDINQVTDSVVQQ